MYSTAATTCYQSATTLLDEAPLLSDGASVTSASSSERVSAPNECAHAIVSLCHGCYCLECLATASSDCATVISSIL
jgi:hypothetical protein